MSPIKRIKPYYTKQYTDSACSLASIAMIIQSRKKHFISQQSLLKRVDLPKRNKAVSQDGEGVSCIYFTYVCQKSCEAYDLPLRHIKFHEVVEVSEEAKKEFIHHLKQVTTHGSKDMVLQVDYSYFGSTEGHYLVVGEYNKEKEEVVLVDPYKPEEPYYTSSVDILLESMNTKDALNDCNRGYIVIDFLAHNWY